MSFSALKKLLNEKYRRTHGELKDYYLDQEGRIVATIETKEDGTKLITTYIDDERGELHTHFNKIALSVSNKIEEPMIDVLLGMNNDTTITDGKICFYNNPELDKMSEKYNTDRFSQYNLGSIGRIELINDKARLYLGENKSMEGVKAIESQNNGPTHLAVTKQMKIITHQKSK